MPEYTEDRGIRSKIALLGLVLLFPLGAILIATQQSASAQTECSGHGATAGQVDFQGEDGTGDDVDVDQPGPNEGDQDEACVEPEGDNNDVDDGEGTFGGQFNDGANDDIDDDAPPLIVSGLGRG